MADLSKNKIVELIGILIDSKIVVEYRSDNCVWSGVLTTLSDHPGEYFLKDDYNNILEYVKIGCFTHLQFPPMKFLNMLDITQCIVKETPTPRSNPMSNKFQVGELVAMAGRQVVKHDGTMFVINFYNDSSPDNTTMFRVVEIDDLEPYFKYKCEPVQGSMIIGGCDNYYRVNENALIKIHATEYTAHCVSSISRVAENRDSVLKFVTDKLEEIKFTDTTDIIVITIDRSKERLLVKGRACGVDPDKLGDLAMTLMEYIEDHQQSS